MAKLSESIWPWLRTPEETQKAADATNVSETNARPLEAEPFYEQEDASGNEGNTLGPELTAMAAAGIALREPYLLLDLSGTILAANAPAMGAFSITADHQHISSAIRAPQVLDAIDEVIATGDSTLIDYQQRGQVEQRYEVHVSLIELPENISAVTLVLRDLTEQEKTERSRADFVANASHELRTPLASLLGFIETLQGPAKNDEKARGEFLELMRQQANRMSRLIHDLLSLNRIELNVNRQPDGAVNLNRLLGHVAETLGQISQKNGVEIKLDLPEPAISVQGDWDELVQVFQNLIENALKYGSSGKRVEVNVRVPDDHSSAGAEVEVRDYGPGIPLEHLPRLTERFYRVDIKESRGKGGTGLGLAIVKHILNRHRGKLSVRSEEGEGSSFIVKFPVVIK
ncbi:MAG: ATP-binding protein [Hyphomicrobiales bacterium]